MEIMDSPKLGVFFCLSWTGIRAFKTGIDACMVFLFGSIYHSWDAADRKWKTIKHTIVKVKDCNKINHRLNLLGYDVYLFYNKWNIRGSPVLMLSKSVLKEIAQTTKATDVFRKIRWVCVSCFELSIQMMHYYNMYIYMFISMYIYHLYVHGYICMYTVTSWLLNNQTIYRWCDILWS